MSKYIFLLNLDATITRQEILPAISCKLGLYDKMRVLAENAAQEKIPYKL